MLVLMDASRRFWHVFFPFMPKERRRTRTHLTRRTVAVALILLAEGRGEEVRGETPAVTAGPALSEVTVVGATPDYGADAESTSLTSTRLMDLQVDSAEKLNGVSPNVIYDGGGERGFNAISGVRGLMNSLFFTDPTLVFYVDDVPYLSSYSVRLQPDSVSQLSILRGPQGSLFGQNAPGGVVEVTQYQPTPVWAATLTSEYGSYDHTKEFAQVSGPVSKEVSFLASGLYDRRDGYLENTTRGTRPDSQEEAQGRVALRWTPTRELAFDLNVQQGYEDDGVQRFTRIGGPRYQIASRTDGMTDDQSGMQSLKLTYDAGDYKVLFVSSHRSDDLGPNVVDMGFGGPSLLAELDSDEDRYVQELRVSSADDAEWKWTAGLSYSRLFLDPRSSQGLVAGVPSLAAVGSSQGVYDSYAVFGQMEKKVSRSFSVTLGNRLQLDSRSGDRTFTSPLSGTVVDREVRQYANVAPTATATWEVAPRQALFASTGLAFRPGGYAPFSSSTTLKPYGEEQTWSNSAGWKASGWDGVVSSTVTLFWNETHGYQLEQYNFPAADVVNVPEVASRGAEWEAEIRPVSGLTLEAAMGYTLATFVDYHDTVTGADRAGNRVPYVPEETGLLGATYRHPSGWMAHVDWRWMGKTDFDTSNTPLYSQGAYSLLAARVGYEAKHWSAYLYGENLTDAQYDTLIFPTLGVQVPGDPQTVGVRLDLKW